MDLRHILPAERRVHSSVIHHVRQADHVRPRPSPHLTMRIRSLFTLDARFRRPTLTGAIKNDSDSLLHTGCLRGKSSDIQSKRCNSSRTFQAAETCPENQEYTNCGSACALTCEDVNKRDALPRVCTLQCIQGCFCKRGLAKTSNGTCVEPKDCPKSKSWLISNFGGTDPIYR